MRTTRLLLATGSAALLFTLGACSGGGDDGAADDVASLGGDTDIDDNADDAGGGQGGGAHDAEFQDALLEYAECMREQGIDMPDPEFEDGGVAISREVAGGSEGPPSDAEMEEMAAAEEVCEPIMEEAMSSMPEPDPEEIAEMQERALAFAECMREHGIDMSDPAFEEGGGITQQVGGFDDQEFESSDEEFAEAEEACSDEGGFGPGAEPAPAGGDDADDEGGER